MNNRSKGADYELLAKQYLEKQNIKILECNFRNRFGEIDIIGKDGEYLVFFEVKYRTSDKAGNPLEAVTRAKQKQISKVADYYRVIHKISEYAPMRFDVIGILNTQITWVKNAFYYCR